MTSLITRLQNKSVVPYASRVAAGIPSWRQNGRAGQLAAMNSSGTLFSIVNRVSTAVASAEWCLYRVPGPQSSKERTRVYRHAALDLWNKPNPFMNRNRLVETFQQHMELTGEAWLTVSRTDGFDIPLELWPVRPDRIAPIPHHDDFLAGYVYAGPDGERVPLRLNDVIQMMMPNPMDIYRGMGPVQSVLTSIDADRYSVEWNRAFFENSAIPGGIIEIDKTLSDPEFRNMVDRWEETHRGVNRAHRVSVLEHGTWKDASYSMKDMQFKELREVSRDVIREAFGISKTMLGQTEDVNRATAQAAELVFSRWVLKARLDRIKSALNNSLLPMYGSGGQGVEFDYESPVLEDEEAENAERNSIASAVSTLVGAGYHPEDVASMYGLPPLRFIGRSDSNGSAQDGQADSTAPAGA